MRKKACIIEDLSRELLSIQSKINMGNIELDNLNRDDIIINKEIIDILDGYCVTIPVVHVSGNRYLIGDSVETVELINESRA